MDKISNNNLKFKGTQNSQSIIPKKPIKNVKDNKSQEPSALSQTGGIKQETIKIQPKEINKNVLKLKMTIKKGEQAAQKIDELTLKLKNNSQRVSLFLDTYFEDDQSMLKFGTQFARIASQVTYLDWIVSGFFTDDGQGKVVGDVFGRLLNAYRINIRMNSPFFADKSALSLANGLKKLVNLHVLSLGVSYQDQRQYKALTKVGVDKIKDNLSNLPNLELLYWDLIRDVELHRFPKLSNLQNYINDSIDDYFGGDEESYMVQNAETVLNTFKSLIDQRKSYLVTIIISPYDYYHYTKKSRQNEIFYYQMFQYLFNLPYLTDIQSENYKHASTRQFQGLIWKCILLLELFTKQKMITIFQTIIFQQEIESQINFNPKLIIIDLWIN